MGTIAFPAVPLTGHERSLDELTRPDERMLSYQGLSVEKLQAPYLSMQCSLPSNVPQKIRERMMITRQLAVHGFFVYEFHAVSMFWALSCIEMALKMKFEESQPDPITMTRKADDGTELTEKVPLSRLEEFLQQRRREKWRVTGLKDFDYSFRALLAWAFKAGLLPEDIPIPIEEIRNSAENRFMLETFPKQAKKDGLLKVDPRTLGDITECWRSLSPAQQKHYLPKASTVLVEELPRFRNMMAHPKHFNLIVFPAAPVGTYQMLIEMVSRLWPDNP